jgi:hypothetical protein
MEPQSSKLRDHARELRHDQTVSRTQTLGSATRARGRFATPSSAASTRLALSLLIFAAWSTG